MLRLSLVKICHQFETYAIAMPPSVRFSSKTLELLSNLAAMSESDDDARHGIRRKKRRNVEVQQRYRARRLNSTMKRRVIRKPLSTKKISTPRTPPGIEKQWTISTIVTANTRNPVKSGM